MVINNEMGWLDETRGEDRERPRERERVGNSFWCKFDHDVITIMKHYNIVMLHYSLKWF